MVCGDTSESVNLSRVRSRAQFQKQSLLRLRVESKVRPWSLGERSLVACHSACEHWSTLVVYGQKWVDVSHTCAQYLTERQCWSSRSSIARRTRILKEHQERKLSSMGDKTDKQDGIAADDQRQTVVTRIACKAPIMRASQKGMGGTTYRQSTSGAVQARTRHQTPNYHAGRRHHPSTSRNPSRRGALPF